MKLLVLIKNFIKKYRAIDNYCKDCGRKAEPFEVSDKDWQEVVGNNDVILCKRCYKIRCAKQIEDKINKVAEQMNKEFGFKLFDKKCKIIFTDEWVDK